MSLVEPETLLDEVGAALAAGATQIKLKITPDHDVDPLRRVREQYPDVDLAADANGSYASATDVPRALQDLDLAYLEQPLAADDLAGAAALARGWSVPIALDESLTSADRLDAAAAILGVPFVASVKVGRLGGIGETVRMLETARDLGVDAFVGGMLETAVGRSIALAFAAQAPCDRPTDAGPTARYFAADVGPAVVPDANGALRLFRGPGIGFVPDREALDRFCVDRMMVAT